MFHFIFIIYHIVEMYCANLLFYLYFVQITRCSVVFCGAVRQEELHHLEGLVLNLFIRFLLEDEVSKLVTSQGLCTFDS